MPTRSCAVRVSAATLDEALPRRSVLSVFAMVLELPTVCELARSRCRARASRKKGQNYFFPYT
jgi:hypothetical protein